MKSKPDYAFLKSLIIKTILKIRERIFKTI